MTQTRTGAANNPWVTYMKACSAAYKAERAQQQDATDGVPKVRPTVPTPKRKAGKPRAKAQGDDVESGD